MSIDKPCAALPGERGTVFLVDQSLDFTFDHTASPGMLEFSCHYGRHYEAGMHQAIVVKGAPGASVAPYSNDDLSLSSDTSTVPCDPAITTKIVNGAYTPANISLNDKLTVTIQGT